MANKKINKKIVKKRSSTKRTVKKAVRKVAAKQNVVAKKKATAKKKAVKKIAKKVVKRGRPKKVVELKTEAKKVVKRGKTNKAIIPNSDELLRDIVEEPVVEEIAKKKKVSKSAVVSDIEQIIFKLPIVKDPLIGSPKEVKKELNGLAKKIQRRPKDHNSFDKIHLYMHGHLINMVLKKFPFIRGMQTSDIYQETLIALRFKAIPNFKDDKGMSFLNFAKMCIRKHLITLLHASRHRKKNKPMNQAVSIDTPLANDADENGERNSLSNVLPDPEPHADEELGQNEAFAVTLKSLMDILSYFEQVVLDEYLTNESYQNIAKNVSKKLKKRYNAKSIDNALLRIRKKAHEFKKKAKKDKMPLFIKK